MLAVKALTLEMMMIASFSAPSIVALHLVVTTSTINRCFSNRDRERGNVVFPKHS